MRPGDAGSVPQLEDLIQSQNDIFNSDVKSSLGKEPFSSTVCRVVYYTHGSVTTSKPVPGFDVVAERCMFR